MAMEIVLVLVCSLLIITPRAAGTAILDVDGDEVRRGQLYYVVSVMRPGGGLGLVARNESCPLFVAQVKFNLWRGQPVAFFPENPEDNTVQEGRTLNVMFPHPTECSESTVWKVDGATGYVTTGGTTSATVGPHDSRFAIYKVGESHPAYQIEVCPCSVGAGWPSCRAGCLGTIKVQGVNTNRPYLFVKVKEQETSTIRSAIVRPN